MCPRTMPVPSSVSTQIQALIAAPLRLGWNVLPKRPRAVRMAIVEADHYPSDYDGIIAGACCRCRAPAPRKARLPMPLIAGSILSR